MTEITDLNPVDESNTSLTGNGITGGNFVSNFDNAMRGLLGLLGRLNSGASPISDAFSIAYASDLTAAFRFDASGITPGQKRVITIPDQDLTLGGGTAASITFTPAGNIAATDVQAAIQELDTEKVAKAGDTMSGSLTATAFVPSSSSVPTNGMFLPNTDNLGWAVGGAHELTLTSARLAPAANDGLVLGSATSSFSDLFLASGGIVNWNNGNFTLTHSSGVLTASGNIAVADDAYAVGWNGSANVPTKNAVYDKIELVLGTTLPATYQPLDAGLTAHAALVTAANKAVYYTAADTPVTYDISAYGRTLANLADETALEALLDALPNLTSIQGRTVTLADAGADALLGWDDSASAYQNLSAADARTALGVREVLTAARTYYVRTDGSDSNDGLANTSGGAFLTLQKAIDVAAALDTSIYNVTIQLAAGTYSSGVLTAKATVGAGRVIIVGDETTPANVVLAITSSSGSHGLDSKGVSTVYELRGVQMTCTGGTAASSAINVELGYVLFQNIDFSTGWGFHIRAGQFGKAEASGNYTISAGAVSHWRSQTGFIFVNLKTVTLTGTPAFTTFANANICGTMQVNANTFSGSATGVYYSVTLNGVIQTAGGGATYLPGNSAGSTATGGQYA